MRSRYVPLGERAVNRSSALRNQLQLAASGKATQVFFDKLKSSVATLQEDRLSPVFSFFGFPIHVADDLPPGVLDEFRNVDGELVGRITE